MNNKSKGYKNKNRNFQGHKKKRMEYSQKILLIITILWSLAVAYCLGLYTVTKDFPNEILAVVTSVMIATVGAYYTKTGFDNHAKITKTNNKNNDNENI